MFDSVRRSSINATFFFKYLVVLDHWCGEFSNDTLSVVQHRDLAGTDIFERDGPVLEPIDLVDGCWGIREKTLQPRNVGFVEVHEISFQVMCENSSHIWLLHVNLLSISGSQEPASIWNHEPAKNLNHEPAKIWSQEPANTWNHEPLKIWTHGPIRLRSLRPANAWVQIPEIRESWVKVRRSERSQGKDATSKGPSWRVN
jgi:hypothetical protein